MVLTISGIQLLVVRMPNKATKKYPSKQRAEEATIAGTEANIDGSHVAGKTSDATPNKMSLANPKTAEVEELKDLSALLQAELESLPTTLSSGEGTTPEEGVSTSCKSEKLTFAIIETAKRLHLANREKELIVHKKYTEILEAGTRAKKMSEMLAKKSSEEAERIKAAALESAKRLISEAKREAALTKQDAHQVASEVKKKGEEEAHKLKSDAEIVSKEIVAAAEKQSADILSDAEASAQTIIVAATEEKDTTQREKAEWEKEKVSMEQCHNFDSSKILLDVGGSRFSTRLSTLTNGVAEGSMLAAMFSGRHALDQDEKDGSYFIDRDGTYFGTVLNYLRDPSDFEDPKSDEVRRILEKEARYYQIEPLQVALRYLPVAFFAAQSGHGTGGGWIAQGNDILSHLNRQPSGGFVAHTVSSAAQILQGSMEDVVAAMIKTKLNSKNIQGQQLNSACLNAAFISCSQGGPTSRQQRRNFAAAGNHTAQSTSSSSRALVMMDFGDNLVSTSSLAVQLQSQFGSESPRLNCTVALISEYGATPKVVSQSDLSAQAHLQYCIECSANEIFWASKVIVMLEVPDHANNGAMQAAYYGYNDHNNYSIQSGGLQMYGSLRQIRGEK